MSNGYWSAEELVKVQLCADNSATNALKYRWLRKVSGVLCVFCFVISAVNAHDLSNWMSFMNAVSGWYLYRIYRLDLRLEQLWDESCYHIVKSTTEPPDKADWHARRMRDCAYFLLERDKTKTKEIKQ